MNTEPFQPLARLSLQTLGVPPDCRYILDMTNAYAEYVDRNANEIATRKLDRHAAGEYVAWGSEDMTPYYAAEDVDASIVLEHGDGSVLAVRDGRLYAVYLFRDRPVAVEVASADDLSSRREYGADRSVTIQMRVSRDERDAYDTAAAAAEVSRSEWLRAAAAAALARGGVT